MTEATATQKIQTLAEAKIRVQQEARGYMRLQKTESSVEALKDYIFGISDENPYEEICNTRDNKINNIELQIQEILNTVKVA